MAEGRDYRETVFLPDLPGDPFPLRAGLPKKEPEQVARWQAMGLYALLRRDAAARPKFVLHDGPPYANGAIHIGHAENKILKDFVVRSKQMTGFDCDYVPGWDCHGLPIEWKVEEDFRKAGRKKQDVPAVEFRKACRAYADKWIPLQKEEFQRLGIEGDWEKYYTTMSFEAEAAIAAEFLRVVKTGLVYRGSKPVMWSPVERTSLAEAEVEYQEKTSPTIWVKFPIIGIGPTEEQGGYQLSPPVLAAQLRSAWPSLTTASVVIWTTTPWTIPGNRAISYSESVDYGLYEVISLEAGLAFEPWAKPGDKLVIADRLASDVFGAARIAEVNRVMDIDPSGLICAHPLRDWRPILPRGEGVGDEGRSNAQAPDQLHAPHPPTPSPQGGGGAYSFDVPVLPGDHVTDDAGTGFVHTAPGHGQDDFEVWVKHYGQAGIPFTVDADGRFTKEAPGFEGLEIIQTEGKNLGKDGPANKAVIDALIEAGALLARGQLKHQYPHSWRSKAPLIYRNTPQWFIALDKPYQEAGGKTLRQVALSEIERVDWGQHRIGDERDQNRIKGMIEDRPDWLISRQRAWGVPLPIFVRKSDGSILQDEDVNARIVAAMKQGGADVWWATPAREFLGAKYKAEEFEKVEDILDVWFDSGSTHAFVLGDRDAPTRPSFKDARVLYLEGSDQHRGWFHSSLLESCATRGRAPYDEVITYGFAVGEDGRKMSKSLGNGIEPQELTKQFGIEPFRLLIAAADYRDELRVGKTIIDQASEMYRKLRNTLRFCLGALKGFEEVERFPFSLAEKGLGGEGRSNTQALERLHAPHPPTVDAVHRPPQGGGGEEPPLLERWLYHRLWQLDRVVREAYATYQFRDAVSAIVDFCNVDFSAFYVDVRKDALYCDPPHALRRRACRTAIDETFSRLTAWLAPILPFTTEEAWLVRFPEGPSVHLRQFPETPDAWEDEFAGEEIARLRAVRSVVTGALELARRDKVIGAALEAAPRVFVTDDNLRASMLAVDFAELCITSQVTIEAGEGPPGAFRLPEIPHVAVMIEKARGAKCARSWKYFDPATANPRYPDITPRDAEAVAVWDAAHGR
ncbi:MAG: isoleucine--tRNA ligase [Hyphomonadaceae bacterium]|nr:isoleucine--tRNA ligase [Hyphomonadaceae bacterium]